MTARTEPPPAGTAPSSPPPHRRRAWLVAESSPDEEQKHVDDAMDEALFRVIYPGLRRFAAIWAPASVEPDDLVQHAAANALARGPLHRLDDPAAYLRSTIANLARNLYRRRNPLPLDTADLSLAVEAAADSYPSDLAELDVLRPHERVALYLVDIERFTHAEAAAILGGSAAAMRARTVRARARLRTSIRDEEGR